MLSTDHTLGADRSPFASHPSCFPAGLLVVEPQALQGPGEEGRGARSSMGGSLGLVPGRWRQCRWRCRGNRVAWEGVRQRRLRRASSRTCLWGLVLSTGRRKRWPRTVATRAEYVWSPSTGQSCRAMCACSWLGSTGFVTVKLLLLSRFSRVRLCATP